jgi:hypothetical protein
MYRVLDKVLSPVFDPPSSLLVGLLFRLDEKIHHVNLTRS